MPDEPSKPVTETTTEKHETVVTKGDAAQSVAIITAPTLDDIVRAVLAIMVVSSFSFMLIYGQIEKQWPPEDIVTTYVGFVMLALGFYLGSSYGSSAKDKAMAVK